MSNLNLLLSNYFGLNYSQSRLAKLNETRAQLRAVNPLSSKSILLSKRKRIPIYEEGSILFNISPSDLSSYSKVFRLKNYLEGRSRSLIKYYNQTFDSPNNLEVLQSEVNLLRQLSSRLVYNTVVFHTRYRRVYLLSKRFPRNFQDHCIKLFGYYRKPIKNSVIKGSLIDIMFGLYKKRVVCGRKAEVLGRLAFEAKERPDWFYIFNTLTVREGRMEAVFGPGAKVWSKYIQDMDRVFGIASFGSVRNALKARQQGQEYHNYFACVERGSLHGRLHIHVLHIVKTLPSHFVDPNKGSTTCRKREIDAMKLYWESGLSCPMPFRFNYDDAFGRLGWKWPCVKIKGLLGKFEPLQVSDSCAIIPYITKYLTKSLNMEESLKWQNHQGITKIWRVRLSRKLGLIQTKKLVNQISFLQAKILLTNHMIPRVQDTQIPNQLIRRLLMKNYLRRIINYCRKKVIDIIHLKKYRVPLCTRLLGSIGLLKLHSPPSSMSSSLTNLREMDAFKRVQSIFESFISIQWRLQDVKGINFASV